MKKLLSITFLTIVSLASVLLNLSCNGTPQNSTASRNAANGNTANANTAKTNAAPDNTDRTAAASVDEICSSDSSEKPGKIKAKMERDVKGDDRLNYQHESCQSGCRKERFFFEPVTETTGDVTLYIWGSIFIQDKNNDLDNLHKKYKDYLKKGCVAKVVFTSPPARGVTTTTLQNFEYTMLCEHPNQICRDGTCQQDCDRRLDNSNTSAGSHSNK